MTKEEVFKSYLEAVENPEYFTNLNKVFLNIILHDII